MKKFFSRHFLQDIYYPYYCRKKSWEGAIYHISCSYMLVMLLFECHHATQVFKHMVVVCVEILTLGQRVFFFSLIQLPL